MKFLTKRIIFILTMGSLIHFSGCSTKPSPPEDIEIIEWFEKNKLLLEKLVKIGIEHNSLKRIEPAVKDCTHQYNKLSNKDKIAEEELYQILAELKVDFVSYYRERHESNGTLLSVDIPYYRWGLMFGGYVKGITYFPDYNKTKKDDLLWTQYKYLGYNGWFIEESDTR